MNISLSDLMSFILDSEYATFGDILFVVFTAKNAITDKILKQMSKLTKDRFVNIFKVHIAVEIVIQRVRSGIRFRTGLCRQLKDLYYPKSHKEPKDNTYNKI